MFVCVVFRDVAPPVCTVHLKCWMRVPRRVPPRWIRLHMYRMNRERYLRSLVATPVSSRVVISDLPTEIMVKIFNYVLASHENDYNIALPKVCSRWTRIMYGFIYVHGFRVADYDPFVKRQLSLFADMMVESEYNLIVPEDICRGVLHRYRLAMHPRVITFTILRAEPKEGSEHSVYAARSTQQLCATQYDGLLFKDMCECVQNVYISVFVLAYTRHLFTGLKDHLQAVLETKFIRRINLRHLIDSEVSILKRKTVWHEFADAIKEGLRVVHEPIDEMMDRTYTGPQLTIPMRKRIIYLINNVT